MNFKDSKIVKELLVVAGLGLLGCFIKIAKIFLLNLSAPETTFYNYSLPNIFKEGVLFVLVGYAFYRFSLPFIHKKCTKLNSEVDNKKKKSKKQILEEEEQKKNKWLYPIYGILLSIPFSITFFFTGGFGYSDTALIFIDRFFNNTAGWTILISPIFFAIIGFVIGVFFWKNKIGKILLVILIVFLIQALILTMHDLSKTIPPSLIIFLKHLNNSENLKFISGIYFSLLISILLFYRFNKLPSFILLIIVLCFSIQPVLLTYQQLHLNKEQLIKKWDLVTVKEIAQECNLTEWQVNTPFLEKHENIRYYDLGDSEWRYKRKTIKALLKKDGFIK